MDWTIIRPGGLKSNASTGMGTPAPVLYIMLCRIMASAGASHAHCCAHECGHGLGLACNGWPFRIPCPVQRKEACADRGGPWLPEQAWAC